MENYLRNYIKKDEENLAKLFAYCSLSNFTNPKHFKYSIIIYLHINHYYNYLLFISNPILIYSSKYQLFKLEIMRNRMAHIQMILYNKRSYPTNLVHITN